MTNMIKLIYNDIQSCVKLLSSSGVAYSECFNVTVGATQGVPLSPFLFILFNNDVCDSLETDKGIELLSMYLLFADDIALFTTDHVSLQAQMNSLYEYSVKWGLKGYVNKTNLCVFEKKRLIETSSFT